MLLNGFLQYANYYENVVSIGILFLTCIQWFLTSIPAIQLAPEPEAPARIVQIQAQPDAASSASALAERPPDFGEYVDFGAHTGDNGAFGWYADYPINNHDDSSYRK